MPPPIHQSQDIGNTTKQSIGGLTLSTRLALAMVSLVLVTTAVLSLITYHSINDAVLPRALDRLVTKAMLIASNLETVLNNVGQDVSTFQNSNGVAQLGVARTAFPFVPESDREIRGSIASRLSRVLKAKSEYAQIRIIGVADGGRELVRIDRGGPGGAIRIVPDAELMQVGEQDYFKRAIGLPKYSVYASPIELRENGGADLPATPILYVAVPLWTANEQLLGVAVIDVDLGARFDRIRAEKTAEVQVFLANGAGDYLLLPDRGREGAFEAGAAVRVQSNFPQFDEALAEGGPDSGIWKDRGGARFGVGWAPVTFAGRPGLTIVVASGYANLDHGLAAVSSSAQIGGGVAVLLAVLLAIVLARSLSEPLVQITDAARGLSRGELKVLPSGGGGEIGVLSNAFASMATELKAKQALLENTIASISDPVLVADEHGRIVIANAAARRLLEIDPGANPAKAARQFNYFYPDGVTPLPRSSSALARALRGESVDDLEFIVQPEAPCVPAYFVANARPLRDETGALRGAVAVFRNITEHRQAHQSLVDSEKMAQAIINSAVDAFVQMDATGIVLDWSPPAESMLGWTRSEAVGVNVCDLIAPEAQRAANRQRAGQFLHQFMEGAANSLRFEMLALHRDRREIFTEVSLTALRRGDGYIVNAFLRDITQKRAAEEQLIQAQKMESVGQLTGGIAHDFNNILTVITGTIEILAAAVKDRPDLALITQMISEAADRGSDLTANLLSFARKQPLQPATTDVNELVNETARLLAPTLGRQIEIETALSDHLWRAHVDPGQLSSALVNLAINARDAMPDGGKLTLTTSNKTLDGPGSAASGVDHPGDYIVIEVTDTGIGIPEAIRDKIFDPFFSTKETGRGTGLGLSMVFGFAKQSGGNIEVRSEEGRGTRFRIYLPRADLEAVQLAAAADLQSPGGAETILCVEDDPGVRAYAIAQLQSLGYKVLVASNAAEALAIAEAGAEFDLLFTDIVMPGKLNGRQLAEAMALQRPSLRVLFTSGYTYNAFTRPGQAAPDIRLLAKPYRRAELARMLRRCLDTPVGAASDSISLPPVQEDLDRFMRMEPQQLE